MDPTRLLHALMTEASAVPEKIARVWAERTAVEVTSRWPTLRVEEVAFARHVLQAAKEHWSTSEGTDLALAWACAQGDPEALAIFERELAPAARASVLRIAAPAEVDDVLQQVRERVLLGQNGRPPRIASYSGQGPLSAWVRAAAARVALNATRGVRREVADEDRLATAPAALDLETELARGQHRPAFEAAFREALASLTARERTLLKLHFVDGLSLERIGAAYRAHKSTVSRWLAAARGQLLRRTRARLGAELGLDDRQLRSLARALRSRLDLSLSGLVDEES